MAKQGGRGISWTDETWNPTVGCTKVSAGCLNCWAEKAAIRHYHNDFPKGWSEKKVLTFPERLEQPLRWKRPRKIAVSLMGDLFHENVPDDFIDHVFLTMQKSSQHKFQILTKLPERMFEFLSSRQKLWEKLPTIQKMQQSWPIPNVWIGVTVEDQEQADKRIPFLLKTPAFIRYVSLEPLLGPVGLKPWINFVF